MRVSRGRAICAVIALGGGVQAQAVETGRLADGPNHLLVTFSDRPDATVVAERLRGLGAVAVVVPEAGAWRVAPAHPIQARALALARPRVRTAEWSLARRSDETTSQPTTTATDPGPAVDPEPFNDPLFAPTYQWGLSKTTWTPSLVGFGSRPRIAILDGGVDATHEEWRGEPSVLVDPYSSYDDRQIASDWGVTGHGTHVAGIAAAPANNGVGIAGVAPSAAGTAEVIPIRIADRQGTSTDETMMKGIRWAVNHGAKVINISAGGPGYSQAFQNTVNWALPKALIVASVGNEGDNNGTGINYPAAYDHVLGVGAQCNDQVDKRDCPVAYGPDGFSNHNRSLDVIAPGVDVLSSIPTRVTDERVLRSGYGWKDGTSMAAPFVSGVAALVFAANPDASPDQVLRHIEATAIDLGPKGRDLTSGAGLVDPAAAVRTPIVDVDPGERIDSPRNVSRIATSNETSPPLTASGRVDYFDDPHDLFPLDLTAGNRITIVVRPTGGIVGVRIWRPGTSVVNGRLDPGETVGDLVKRGYRSRLLAAQASALRPGMKRLTFTARARGRYFVDVVSLRASADYTLNVARP